VLGYRQMGSPVGQYMGLTPPDGIGIQLLLQRVDDPKTSKNRLHLDLRAADFERELDRVLAAGARRMNEEPLAEHGWTWHVLADPDGNEFCLIQPPEAG
jgi:predicted enzyme related to lactoylglutathione lyase